MGRETFLARVIWENGWPVIAPGVGHLEDEFTIDMPEHRFAEEITNSDVIHFWGEQLDQRLVAIEDWTSGIYSLTEREGALRMYLRKEKISERAKLCISWCKTEELPLCRRDRNGILSGQ